jgi:poly-beta-1,6-N-acetyl-D-glucosamine biosynthesis protein PgaD
MKRNFIIDGRQKKGKRLFEYFVTLTGWIYIGVFLVQLFLSLLLWSVGVHFFRRFIISAQYYTQTIQLFLFTIKIVAFILFITLSWSYYNKYRFGKLRRRKMPIEVTVTELSGVFSVPETFIRELQTQRLIHLDGEFEEIG